MDEEEKKRILAEIESKRKEFEPLRASLNELNSQKESWFEKKRKASQEIGELIGSMRDAKGKRNTFTKQVKDSKQRRQELNDQLKQKRAEMEKLQKEKAEITKKFEIRVDPSRIKQEIEQLEFKIETEALPFNVEQRVMKIIGEKKKLLAQSRVVSDVFEKIHVLYKELDRIKKKADETHRKVQSKAESSQQFHEELVESSKDIKALRAKEEEALKKFVELKTQYNEQNELARKKFDEINDLRAKIDGFSFEEKKKARKDDEKKLEEKERSVEEKIKKGMKLTTEDLLAFQASEQMRERPGRDNRQRPQKRREDRKQEERRPEQKREQQPEQKKEVKKEEAPAQKQEQKPTEQKQEATENKQ